jgi:arginase
VLSTLRLLHPEWQGYGLGADVYRGAVALAAALFGDRAFTTIDAPEHEALHVEDDVLGLHSIAPRLERTTAELRRLAPDRIVTIGGTCGVEVAPVTYLNARYGGDLAVFWLDAHADLNTPASSPSGHFHGMPLRTLLGEGPARCTRHVARPLEPRQIFLVGVRDLDPPEADLIRHHGIPVLGDEVFRDPSVLVERARARRLSRAYVHFDVDVLNPEGFRSALMRTPGGGPSLTEAVSAIGAVADGLDLVGFSVLEYCERDPAETAKLARTLARLFD